MTHSPLLRAPPFPARDVVLSRLTPEAIPLPEGIFAKVRAARVGGAFWAAPANLPVAPSVVLRLRPSDDPATLASNLTLEERGTALWVASGTSSRKIARLVKTYGGHWLAGAVRAHARRARQDKWLRASLYA